MKVPKKYQVKKSVMTGKLKNIVGINTSSLDNEFCLAMAKNPNNICSECFSQKMQNGIRKNCTEPWKQNGIILASEIIPNEYVLNLMEIYCRLSAHGELINDIHLINYMNIVKANKKTKFALWTKRKNLVINYFDQNKKPSNLQLIYSSPKKNIQAKKPMYFDRVFTAYEKQFAIDNNIQINCADKKCFNCAVCYHKNKTVFINEIIK